MAMMSSRPLLHLLLLLPHLVAILTVRTSSVVARTGALVLAAVILQLVLLPLSAPPTTVLLSVVTSRSLSFVLMKLKASTHLLAASSLLSKYIPIPPRWQSLTFIAFFKPRVRRLFRWLLLKSSVNSVRSSSRSVVMKNRCHSLSVNTL